MYPEHLRFTLKNIRRICQDNNINVLVLIKESELNLFVNSEKDKIRLKEFDEIRPCYVAQNIYLEKSMIIDGFTILQTFEVPFFKDLYDELEKYKQREYNSFKKRLRRFYNKISRWKYE